MLDDVCRCIIGASTSSYPLGTNCGLQRCERNGVHFQDVHAVGIPTLLQPLRRPQPPQPYCWISPSLVGFAIYCEGIYMN